MAVQVQLASLRLLSCVVHQQLQGMSPTPCGTWLWTAADASRSLQQLTVGPAAWAITVLLSEAAVGLPLVFA